jgi:hypothetical protein
VSEFFSYICTKTTADPFIPPRAISLDTFSRDVSDAFTAISGGRFEVGRIAIYPVQRSVANHLLCDGREVSKASFPELYSYLGDTQGTPVNPDNFLLPDYLTAFAPAPTADIETAADGTVTTPPPAVPPPTDYPERTDRVWGNVDSGGRRGNIP